MKNNRKGFTLLEIIIATSILAVAALLMYTFIGQGFRLYKAESESAKVQQDIRQVLSEITNKTRVSEKTNISISGNTLNIDDYAYTLTNDAIYRDEFKIADEITAFSFSITDEILDISISNQSGDTITTSLSLRE